MPLRANSNEYSANIDIGRLPIRTNNNYNNPM